MTPAILDRVCASCGRRQVGMIALDGTRQCPGVWYLCGACGETPTTAKPTALPVTSSHGRSQAKPPSRQRNIGGLR